jgi:hypothetical protein
VVDRLSTLRSAFEDGQEESNKFDVKRKVNISGNAVRIIRLSGDELTVVVALNNGKVLLYNIESILSVSQAQS